MIRLSRWIAAAVLVSPLPAIGQIELVRDINTQFVPQSSSPFFLGSVTDGAVFLARTAEGAPMLWKSDGTSAGTVELVADFTGGPDQFGTQLPGRVLFFEAAANGTRRLWVTDGSSSGTRPLIDGAINGLAILGPIGSRAVALHVARVGADASEIWITDGTPAGTRLVRTDSPALPGIGRPIANVGGRLFFYGAEQSSGTELWMTDGTAAGTRIVADVVPGPTGSDPWILGTQGNDVYFTVSTAAGPPAIWRVSAVTGAAAQFADDAGLPGFPGVGELLGAANGFYYRADGELWFNTGSPGSSIRVRDFNPAGDDDIEMLGFVGNRLLVRARSATSGATLWSTDGTPAGTLLVRDLSPGLQNTGIATVDGFGSSMMLSLRLENGSSELWWTDGTTGGTRPIVSDPQAQLGSSPYVDYEFIDFQTVRVWRVNVATGEARAQTVAGLTQAGGATVRTPDRRIFFGCTLGSAGYEPCFSDGTAAGTRVLRDIVTTIGNDSSRVRDFTRIGNIVYFVADDGVNGEELWRTDGTPQGTGLVRDIRPGPGGSTPRRLVALGGVLYFVADDGVHGQEPWRSDGTPAGTYMLGDINPGFGSSFGLDPGAECRGWIARQGSGVVFIARDASSGPFKLWIIDGNAGGPRPLVPGPGMNAALVPCNLVHVGGLTYFTPDDPTAGREWFRTDGTAAGTFLLVDAREGSLGQDWPLPPPVSLGGITYFTATIGESGRPQSVLWQTDGTREGTRQVSLPQGTTPSIRNLSGVFLSRLIVNTVRDGVEGLFLLDPLTGSAERISLSQTDSLAGESRPVVLGSRLVFLCTEGLCATEGSAASTRLLLPAAPFSDPWRSIGALAVEGNLGYFMAVRDSQGGRQLWVTDGTPAGTRRLTDLALSAANDFAIAGGMPVFGAFDDRGLELWRVSGLLPGAAVLRAPGGPTATSQPSFSWRATLGAQEYLLWVDDGSGVTRIRRWFTAAEAGCAQGVGTCAVQPGVTLSAGVGRWWVQSWNAAGFGPWSAPLSFTIGVAPGLATLLGPSGATGARPTYSWRAVSSAQEYLLWVDDQAGVNRIRQWVSAVAAGCGSGEGTCSFTPATSMPLGRSRFFVQTWNPLGYGPWSAAMTFYVGGVPGAATLLSPSGALGSATPTYSWSAIPGAVEYLLWVDDATAAPRVRVWIQAGAAGCGGGTGTCSFTPATPLAPGAGRWWIQTWNPVGFGPWSSAMGFTR